MVLVVLLPLFLALLWSGMFGIALSQVTVSARHNAWRQRQEVQPKAFEFDDSSAGKITKSSSQSIRLSPLFDGWTTPKSACSVFGGSWDHRVIKLNDRSPNRQLAIDVATRTPKAKLESVQATFSSIGDLVKLENLKSVIASLLDIQGLDTGFGQLKQAGETQQQNARDKAAEAKKKAAQEQQKELDSKTKEIEGITKRIEQLSKDIDTKKKELAKAATSKEKAEIALKINVMQKEQEVLENKTLPLAKSELDQLKKKPSGADL